jgi:predicted  nucleic acid-binding Zn-ribbon protein
MNSTQQQQVSKTAKMESSSSSSNDATSVSLLKKDIKTIQSQVVSLNQDFLERKQHIETLQEELQLMEQTFSDVTQNQFDPLKNNVNEIQKTLDGLNSYVNEMDSSFKEQQGASEQIQNTMQSICEKTQTRLDTLDGKLSLFIQTCDSSSELLNQIQTNQTELSHVFDDLKTSGECHQTQIETLHGSINSIVEQVDQINQKISTTFSDDAAKQQQQLRFANLNENWSYDRYSEHEDSILSVGTKQNSLIFDCLNSFSAETSHLNGCRNLLTSNTNPVIRLRRGATSEELDFYDVNGILNSNIAGDGVRFEEWCKKDANEVAFCVKLYGQNNNGNVNASQNDPNKQPLYIEDCMNSRLDFSYQPGSYLEYEKTPLSPSSSNRTGDFTIICQTDHECFAVRSTKNGDMEQFSNGKKISIDYTPYLSCEAPFYIGKKFVSVGIECMIYCEYAVPDHLLYPITLGLAPTGWKEIHCDESEIIHGITLENNKEGSLFVNFNNINKGEHILTWRVLKTKESGIYSVFEENLGIEISNFEDNFSKETKMLYRNASFFVPEDGTDLLIHFKSSEEMNVNSQGYKLTFVDCIQLF